MILVDTSIWIDHLRSTQPVLVGLLEQGQVVTHPFVIAELALGSISGRTQFLGYLQDLPTLAAVSQHEFLAFIEGHALSGRGIGLVGGHLLAATLVVPGTSVWTRDRRLATTADDLGVRAEWS